MDCVAPPSRADSRLLRKFVQIFDRLPQDVHHVQQPPIVCVRIPSDHKRAFECTVGVRGARTKLCQHTHTADSRSLVRTRITQVAGGAAGQAAPRRTLQRVKRHCLVQLRWLQSTQVQQKPRHFDGVAWVEESPVHSTVVNPAHRIHRLHENLPIRIVMLHHTLHGIVHKRDPFCRVFGDFRNEFFGETSQAHNDT